MISTNDKSLYTNFIKLGNVISLFLFFTGGVWAEGSKMAKDPELIKKAGQWIEQQTPIGFQENKGQMCDEDGKAVPYILFKAELPNLNIWITTSGLTYQFYKVEEENEREEASGQVPEQERMSAEWHRIDMTLKNASIKKENIITGQDITQGEVNYYLGHCPGGILNVRTYAKVTIKEVYPGIDWMLYTSSDGGIKHDFIVKPYANPDQVKLIYEGSGKLRAKEDQIRLENMLGEITEGKLLCYQGTISTPVVSEYISKQNSSLTHAGPGFLSDEKGRDIVLRNVEREEIGELFSYEITVAIGTYNKSEPLVIDPQLFWSTLYPGSAEVGPMSVDCDANGNVYVAGYTGSFGGPANLAWGSAYVGAVVGGGTDVFLSRFTNVGVRTWSTHYGGTSFDNLYFVKCDPQNNIYLTGSTQSADFPLLSWAGAFNYPNASRGFLVRFDPAGIRIWATELGGSGMSIAFDNSGNGYVTGNASAGFTPVVWAGAYNQAAVGGPFIMRFTSSTGALTWATCYGAGGASAYSVACDVTGNIYVCGVTTSAAFPTLARAGAYNQPIYGGMAVNGGDIFILRFSNTGALTWATFFGGSGDEYYGMVACDASGNVYVTGCTNSANFPVKNLAGSYNQAYGGGPAGWVGGDAFIIRFDVTGVLVWSTYYGGSALENMGTYDNIVIDNCGNVYISFFTLSTNTYTFAGCGNYYDGSFNGNKGTTSWGDQFIVKFNNSGAVIWATYFAGDGGDFREALALDNNGSLFITGEWLTNAFSGGSYATYPRLNPGGGAYFGATGMTHIGYISKFIPTVSTYTQSQVNSSTCLPCNGSATINLACGEPNYNYSWSNGSSTLNSTGTSNTLTGLCPGTYTVTATSNCNQSKTATFVITGTTCGGVTATATSASVCSGTCATITSNGSSGTSPYTYVWSNGSIVQSISPCPSSNTVYTVTVTDNAGATATSTALVTVDPAVTVSISTININCSGGTGSASAAGGSGTPAYTYSWSNLVSGSLVSGLSAGNYTVTVTDSKGCTSTSTTTIFSPPALTGQFAKGSATCAECGCKEWLMVNATGGTSPYSYTWPDGYINRYKNQLCPGIYTINIKDKNGCSVNVNISSP